ncbi:DUF493 family protein [Paenimyroides tangerinum]|uniref:DUF493 family protein n=1 Tax=Paenimyroides tangerinum TaxID=2488728 RepID=A0A3P3W0D6_9FLAO|nr:DUF493 family protein [Paenimyroides tangerinum]RRJ88450.1 DUF493 family protein [Paenimyroides tangerinum]
MDQKTKEFYERLKENLENTTESWPLEYLYKFIVPTNEESVKLVYKAFDGLGAVIKTKHSSTGKFTSVSVNVVMPSSDLIIEKYKEVSSIEGIVSL